METISRKDSDFNVEQKTISDLADLNRTVWGLDGAWLDTVLLPKRGEWEAIWAIYQKSATRTSQITFEKNEKRMNYEEVLRTLIKGLQSNPKVTPENLHEMGIAIPSGEKTPIPVPATYPEARVDTSVIRRLTVHFQDINSKSKAKPHGVHGAEIRYGMRETPPTEVTDLTESAFDTRTPFTLEFAESQRGKIVWFCLRWENTKGEKGPWGEMINAIIP